MTFNTHWRMSIKETRRGWVIELCKYWYFMPTLSNFVLVKEFIGHSDTIKRSVHSFADQWTKEYGILNKHVKIKTRNK